MRKNAFFGYATHQMLLAFPLGLLGASVAFDWLGLGFSRAQLLMVAFYLIIGGLISGVIAAAFGLLDWMTISNGTRARRVGAMQAAGNVFVLVLFAASWALREPVPTAPPWLAYVLSWGGAVGSLITAGLAGPLLDFLETAMNMRARHDARASSASLSRRAI